MFKESDESVVERWIENAYWQYFTGEDFFQTKQPFDPSEFVHFRKRLKEDGLEFLLSQTVALHPEAKNEKEVQIEENKIRIIDFEGNEYVIDYFGKTTAEKSNE